MKSQKAKGTAIAGITGVLPGFHGWKFTLISKKSEITSMSIPAEGYFVRPCPTRPRHGFVESKVLKTKPQISVILKEAKKEDPDAELMIGRPILATCSAILTGDGNFTLGPSNDGATSGKNSICYPICSLENMPTIYKMAGVETNPYFELILEEDYDKSSPFVVQMRDGPLLPQGSTDFIPQELLVKHVVEPHDDLLRWEKECRSFEKGTVVYGKGHGLSSHAAVHCILNNVPFIVSQKPQVGQIVAASKAKPKRLKSNLVWQGINWASDYKATNSSIYEFYQHRLSLAIAIVHNWGRLQYSSFADKLLGAAVGAIFHSGASAVKGELRHNESIFSTQERDDIYKDTDIFESNFVTMLAKAGPAFCGPDFSDGFGGPLWANASALLSQMGAALAEERWADSMILANKIINASHNGGYLLNKFVADSTFDKAALQPGLFFAKNMYPLYKLQTEKLTKKLKISPGKVDNSNYIGIASGEILGADFFGKNKLPQKTSRFVMMLKSCQKRNERWIPFTTDGKTLKFNDAENETIWEIV